MKLITKGNDLQYKLEVKDNEGNNVSVTLQNYYKILIYTHDPNKFIDVTPYLNASNVLSVDYELFKPIQSGQVHIVVKFSENNPDFYNGKYDYMKIINTEYYYESDIEGYIDGTAQWGLIYGSIEDQPDLMQFIISNVSDKDIVGLTQAEYNLLLENDQIKPGNLYIITDNN